MDDEDAYSSDSFEEDAGDFSPDDAVSIGGAVAPVCTCLSQRNVGCVEAAWQLLHAPFASRHEEEAMEAGTAAVHARGSSRPCSFRAVDSLVFAEGSTACYVSEPPSFQLRRLPSRVVHFDAMMERFAHGNSGMAHEHTTMSSRDAPPPGLEALAQSWHEQGHRSSEGATGGSSSSSAAPVVAQFIYSATFPLASGVSRIVYLNASGVLRLLRDVNPDWTHPRVLGVLQPFWPPNGRQSQWGSQRRTSTPDKQQKQQQVFRVRWTREYSDVHCCTNKLPFNGPPRSALTRTAQMASAAAAASVAAVSHPVSAVSSATSDVSPALLSRLLTFDGPPNCSTLTRVTGTARRPFDTLCQQLLSRLAIAFPAQTVACIEFFAKKAAAAGDTSVVFLYIRALRITQLHQSLLSYPISDAPQAVSSATAICVQCANEANDCTIDLELPQSVMAVVPPSVSGPEWSTPAAPSAAQQSLWLVPSRPPSAAAASTLTRRTRPLSASPSHLRRPSATFASCVSPLELAAQLQFDLLAPLPSEVNEPAPLSHSRSHELILSTLRPRFVADVKANSPNRRRRGESLVDTNSMSLNSQHVPGATSNGNKASSMQRFYETTTQIYSSEQSSSPRRPSEKQCSPPPVLLTAAAARPAVAYPRHASSTPASASVPTLAHLLHSLSPATGVSPPPRKPARSNTSSSRPSSSSRFRAVVSSRSPSRRPQSASAAVHSNTLTVGRIIQQESDAVDRLEEWQPTQQRRRPSVSLFVPPVVRFPSPPSSVPSPYSRARAPLVPVRRVVPAHVAYERHSARQQQQQRKQRTTESKERRTVRPVDRPLPLTIVLHSHGQTLPDALEVGEHTSGEGPSTVSLLVPSSVSSASSSRVAPPSVPLLFSRSPVPSVSSVLLSSSSVSPSLTGAASVGVPSVVSYASLLLPSLGVSHSPAAVVASQHARQAREQYDEDESPVVRAERMRTQGVAQAALSAVTHIESKRQAAQQQRERSADGHTIRSLNQAPHDSAQPVHLAKKDQLRRPDSDELYADDWQ